ncbi:unnamed protein product [Prorocentrum cordatum]|uniref:RNA-directed RNA polymerase n=1 Tax=Prorocentrum cordatum TaxID=2364126 RepID=A0ABN9S2G5_9DINO|nr:unnamed protein product [Polarella glacialis]
MGDGRWMCLTPDMEITQHNLNELRHYVLDRNAQFPRWVLAGLYAFDPIDPGELLELKRQARQRAALLGAGDPEDEADLAWVIAEPQDARFGEVVPEDVVENPNRCAHLRRKGIVMLGGQERMIELISRDERGVWMKERKESCVDIRLNGDQRTKIGRRDVDFRDAVEQMEQVELADYTDLGPRAMGEFITSVAVGSGNLTSYQAEWERMSGVFSGGAQCHEHRSLLEIARRAICMDQLNVKNLHCMEALVTRVIQIEMAVQRNPRHPDFSGLEDAVGGPTGATDSAAVPRYTEFAVARQKDRANILKQMRLHKEELDRERPSDDGGKRNRKDKEKDKGKKKKGAVQRSVLESVQERIDFYGNPSSEAVDGERSLREILRSTDQYELEPQHLASYDVTRLRVCKGDINPAPVTDLLPAEAACFLRHFQSQIELSEPEIAERVREAGGMPEPYWDPRLRGDAELRRDFFCRLARIGIAGFRRAIKSRCDAFFARKKDGDIRFICDARATNMRHRLPPRTVLGGAACLSEIDLSGYATALGGFGGVCEPRFSGADVKDCFYQLANEEMGSWFGFDSALTVEGWDPGIARAWGDDVGGWTPARAGELLFPCLRVLPTGWAWALYFAQEAVTQQVRRSTADGDRQLLRDKRPAPLLRPGRPLAAVYADNFTGVGGSAADAELGVRAFEERAAEAGLALRAADAAVEELESLGLVLCGADRRVRQKPERVWRFYFATKALLRRGRATGAELRVWAGHAAALLGLQPCLLSILQDVYHFIGDGSRRRAALPATVRGELRTAAIACFLTEVDLSAPLADEVHVSDSSSSGFCLMHGRKPLRAVWDAYRWRERWRFAEVEADGNSGAYTAAHLKQLRGVTDGFGATLDEGAHKHADARVRAGQPAGAWRETELGKLLFRRAAVGRGAPRRWASRPSQTQEVELLNVVPALQAAAYSVGRRVRWRVRHAPADLNVADEGSRGDQARDPEWLLQKKRARLRLWPPEGAMPPGPASGALPYWRRWFGLAAVIVLGGMFPVLTRQRAAKAASRRRRARDSGRSRVQFMRGLSVAESTRRLYTAALEDFETWCVEVGRQTNNAKDADENMVHWFAQTFFDGMGPGTGRNGLFGWILLRGGPFQDGRQLLPRARRQLKAWERTDPGLVGLPYPLILIWAIALDLLNHSLVRMAACAVLQTDLYSRPSDTLELSEADILRSQPAAGRAFAGRWAVVFAPSESGRRTKTGQTDDTVDVGVCGREWVRDVVAALKDSVQAEERVFDFDLATYEREFKASLVGLRLQAVGGSPHWLRRSGPSNDRLGELRRRCQSRFGGVRQAFEALLQKKSAGAVPCRDFRLVCDRLGLSEEASGLLRHLDPESSGEVRLALVGEPPPAGAATAAARAARAHGSSTLAGSRGPSPQNGPKLLAELRQALQAKHRTVVGAWRACLNPKRQRAIGLKAFKRAVGEAGFTGDAAAAWRALGLGDKGGLTLNRLEPGLGSDLRRLRVHLAARFGSLQSAFEQADRDGSYQLSPRAFAKLCSGSHLAGDESKLFEFLDMEGSQAVALSSIDQKAVQAVKDKRARLEAERAERWGEGLDAQLNIHGVHDKAMAFRQFLERRFGKVLRAWMAVDKGGRSALTKLEFMNSLHVTGYMGSPDCLWRALVKDRPLISFREFHPDAFRAMARFRGACARHLKKFARAFQPLGSEEPGLRLSEDEFLALCRRVRCPKPWGPLFKQLCVHDDRCVSWQDVSWLEEQWQWDGPLARPVRRCLHRDSVLSTGAGQRPSTWLSTASPPRQRPATAAGAAAPLARAASRPASTPGGARLQERPEWADSSGKRSAALGTDPHQRDFQRRISRQLATVPTHQYLDGLVSMSELRAGVATAAAA